MSPPAKHTVALKSEKHNNHVFEVDTKYRPLKVLGQGAYGVVCSATEEGCDEEVAIKKITGVFDEEGNILEAKRTLREIMLLRHMQHENVIAIKHIMFPHPDRESFQDVYIVCDKMDADMHKIIQSSQPLTDDHCKFFLYQMLRGLKYIHSANIIHRDLKPSNLLLNANCDLKITDFGLARAIEPEDEGNQQMTQYVVTRWYRAPEILLMVCNYTKAVDIWSVGCIFAELLQRKALFPGRSYLHQLQLIMSKLGSPTAEDLADIPDKLASVIEGLPKKEAQPFEELFPGLPVDALDILKQLLRFNPAKRPSADEALRHPYLSELHEPENEPEAGDIKLEDLENQKLTWENVKDLMYQEAMLYNSSNNGTDTSDNTVEKDSTNDKAELASTHASTQGSKRKQVSPATDKEKAQQAASSDAAPSGHWPAMQLMSDHNCGVPDEHIADNTICVSNRICGLQVPPETIIYALCGHPEKQQKWAKLLSQNEPPWTLERAYYSEHAAAIQVVAVHGPTRRAKRRWSQQWREQWTSAMQCNAFHKVPQDIAGPVVNGGAVANM